MTLRAAVVQTDPRLGDVAGNLAECLARLEQGATAGCELLVFPECAVSGYMFADADRARRPGRALSQVAHRLHRRRPLHGSEGGSTFFGWSQIVDPHGRRLVEAGAGEALVYADLDLALARAKTKEPGDGPYSVRLFADRRPDLYGPLLDTEGAGA
jgi:predicted amidohydrolase